MVDLNLSIRLDRVVPSGLDMTIKQAKVLLMSEGYAPDAWRYLPSGRFWAMVNRIKREG